MCPWLTVKTPSADFLCCLQVHFLLFSGQLHGNFSLKKWSPTLLKKLIWMSLECQFVRLCVVDIMNDSLDLEKCFLDRKKQSIDSSSIITNSKSPSRTIHFFSARSNCRCPSDSSHSPPFESSRKMLLNYFYCWCMKHQINKSKSV